MLTELRLANFKGFSGEHTLPLSPITLIYGPNSAGKSALIQALALMSQSVPLSATDARERSPLTFRGPYVDLGDFQGVVNGHSRTKSISLGLTHTPPASKGPGSPRDRDSAPSQSTLAFDASFHDRGGLLQVPRLTYFVPDDRERDVGFSGRLDEGEHEGKQYFQPVGGDGLRLVVREIITRMGDAVGQSSPRSGRHRLDLDPPTFTAAYKAVRATHLSVAGFLPEPLRTHSDLGSDTSVAAASLRALIREWQSMIAGRYLETRTALSQVKYLGPLRESPKRIEIRAPSSGRFVGVGGEDTSFLLYRDHDLAQQVNEWLEELEIPYQIRVERLTPRGLKTVGEILTLVLRDSRTDVDVSPKDVGFGISQVLPVVTQCLAGSRLTLLIEQPEIHLHPRLQANLADLMIRSASDPNFNQIIAETHSESLLLRLQKRVREGTLDPSLVKILYVGNTGRIGSWVQQIPIDERGEFTEEWPNGFFEERFEELVDQ